MTLALAAVPADRIDTLLARALTLTSAEAALGQD